MTIIELRQKRTTLVSQARALLDKADADKRALAQEEENQYSTLMDEVNKLTSEIDRREKLEALETTLGQSQGAASRTDGSQAGRETAVQFRSRGMKNIDFQAPEFRSLAQIATPQYAGAWENYLRSGDARGLLHSEQRALQADLDASGGYLYPSMQFVDRLIQAVDDVTFVRRYATIQTVANAESIGAPTLEADPAAPTWTSELLIGTEDSTMAFGQRELTPYPLAKYIKVSRKLLRKVPSAESLVLNRLGYKFGVTAENAYLNGTGAGQPMGVFVAAPSAGFGITTGQDVSTDNTATAITADGLKNAKYALKQGYWRGARWLFHRDAVKMIAKLKDGEGRYLWQDSIINGEPDMLYGFPVDMSEYAPSTFTTGLYVGILANWAYYWIADSLAMEMQRLNELYAATNQVGFIGRLESDGMPVLEAAFARVKLG